jgi:4-hydroxy 2-oxovalerate aldolase
LSTQFIERLAGTGREIVVDSSLCGMGRGAGNTTTELLVNYLVKKRNANYDMNAVMDAIDMYMCDFIGSYSWGYSIPYLISGIYCAHVNNIAYLINDHRTNAIGLRNIIESLSPEDRRRYDYDLLEQKYVDYQNKTVDDEESMSLLKRSVKGRNVLMILPGATIASEKDRIDRYIAEKNPVVVGVNTVSESYRYDWLFFTNTVRYDYAKDIFPDVFYSADRVLTSNIKTQADSGEHLVNFNLLSKRGWRHFDNAGIMCLRLMNKIHAHNVAAAGFDGFDNDCRKSYYDVGLPRINPGQEWSELNDEIRDMLDDFRATVKEDMNIEFITTSKFS